MKLKEPRNVHMLCPDGRNNIKIESLFDVLSFKPIYQPSLFMRHISNRHFKGRDNLTLEGSWPILKYCPETSNRSRARTQTRGLTVSNEMRQCRLIWIT